MLELDLCVPSKSFGTYRREDDIESRGNRPATVTLEKRREKRWSNYIIQDGNEDEEKSNFKQTNDIEELRLPTPIPDLPLVQPEQSPFYEGEDIDDYGECSDGAHDIENVSSIPMFEDDEDIEFAVDLNYTYIVASSSREKERITQPSKKGYSRTYHS